MSATHVIKMPDLGEGIAEVELVAWYVKPGDVVAEDQVLADVMTDKATVEIPSAVSGRVLALGGEVGQTLAVGAELIRIEVGNGANAPQAGAAGTGAVSQAAGASLASTDGGADNTVIALTRSASPSPSAAAPSAVVASHVAAAVGAPAAGSARAAPSPAGRPIASPAVRERAWALGIELAEVPATGPGGRVMQRDLDEYAARHGAPGRPAVAAPGHAPAAAMAPARASVGSIAAAQASAAPITPSTVPAVPPRPRVAAGGDELEQVRFLGLRRKIAQRMQEAKRRIPHFSYVEELDVTELEALRERLNARHGAARGKLTLLPFLVRGMVIALRDFPDLNATFDDEAGVLTRHSAVHIGIAAQTDAGLMVPVLRDAQAHDLWANAAEITRLAEAARTGRVVRDELSGSTITLTSLGKLGGIVSTPVINMPEVAIVGVNRIVERPVMRGGAVVPRLMMNLSSSFDHRVVDGAQAAAFVQSLRELIEHPAGLFIE
jgi:2-oxoisovalerate dehydrogenase E2 component (dihydrolipoyl transacylase)